MIATCLRTWKVKADLRKEVIDTVAQDDSWASIGGTNRLVSLPIRVAQ